MPRLRGKALEAAEQVVGKSQTRQFEDDDGDAKVKPKLTPALVDPVDRPVNKEWADQMAFNEEVIKVMVHESTDKNAEAIVEVFCNGIPQRFIRGRPQDVKRKFVEVLARAKQTTYSNQKVTLDTGDDVYVYPAQTALRYPFNVISDPNRKGQDWLKSVLAEA